MSEQDDTTQSKIEDEVNEILSAQTGFYENPGSLPFEEIKLLIGEPPVLSSEDPELYNTMLLHYMKSLEPKDFMLQMLVKDLMDADWEALRIKRHKAWAIERRNRAAREVDARRVEEERGRALEAAEEKPETDKERLFELECEEEHLSKKAIELVDGLKKPSRAIELSDAMEQSINYYERLDRLEKDTLAKRVILLEQIRLYDEALSARRNGYYDYLDATETARLKRIFNDMRKKS